jgi:hypothetical protein
MRPTPNQIIRGVRDLLREDIAPELGSERAVISLRKIMSILRDLDWNEASFRMRRENAELRTLGEEVLSWIDESTPRRLTFEAALEALNAARRFRDPDSFAQLNDENLAHRRAIAAFVETASRGAAPESAREGVAMRKRIAAKFADLTD